MITNNRLDIFRNFIVKKSKQNSTVDGSVSLVSANDFAVRSSSGIFIDTEDNNYNGFSGKTLFEYYLYRISRENRFTDFVKLCFISIFAKNKKIKEKEKPKLNIITVESFFKDILTSVKDLNNIKDIIKHYDKLIENAEKVDQLALIENIKDKIKIVKSESVLLDGGITKFIHEDQIVKFYNSFTSDKKVLKLTWIQNYSRFIPDDISEKIKKADDLNIFDNYVILHFDPKNINVELTKEQKRKAADPIVFGVFKESTRLYYIGDWVDEDCDLTLDVLLDSIKEPAYELTVDSIKNLKINYKFD
jgi:hypothetical protein